MKPCSLCATPIEEGASVCPHCGVAGTGETGPRRPSRAVRLVAAAATLAAVALVALPAVARWRASDACAPRSWLDWHVAMKKACLTPEYVCENMTSAKLLADPEVAAAYRSALEAGEPGAIDHLDALVGGMRSDYGCDGATGEAHAGAVPSLPPGHPPIGDGAERLPPGHPPIGGEDRLPPGHPPIGGGGRLPPGHPPIGGALAPMFDAPSVVTI
ncbi:zinc ribbon domain-containing protein [Anaeromyxobacter oryzae]|uniref:Zinc-ribbon domain-containing protein n=1 Tax=Anaeromyxobacter oryzae TaxID=2918170 RepID=A0ABM7WY43_9BACT|nr:zinc ribbon domain-containing protein [Anaeromyxobacter oryzae]BDG04446.1 hypothetical protein AMOR_34420 [Anaeromyxobacter oryzae]